MHLALANFVYITVDFKDYATIIHVATRKNAQTWITWTLPVHLAENSVVCGFDGQ